MAGSPAHAPAHCQGGSLEERAEAAHIRTGSARLVPPLAGPAPGELATQQTAVRKARSGRCRARALTVFTVCWKRWMCSRFSGLVSVQEGSQEAHRCTCRPPPAQPAPARAAVRAVRQAHAASPGQPAIGSSHSHSTEVCPAPKSMTSLSALARASPKSLARYMASTCGTARRTAWPGTCDLASPQGTLFGWLLQAQRFSASHSLSARSLRARLPRLQPGLLAWV